MTYAHFFLVRQCLLTRRVLVVVIVLLGCKEHETCCLDFSKLRMLFIIFWLFSTIRSYIDNRSESKSSEMEPPPTKQLKLDVQTKSLVWLDDSIQTTGEDTTAQQELRTLDPNLKIFQSDTECENYIQSQSDQSLVVLIVNGRLGQQIIPRVQDLPQVIAIYIFCFNRDFHNAWSKDIAKVKDVVIHFHDLISQLQTNYFPAPSTEVHQPINDNQTNSENFELDNSYIISDICFDYLSRTEATDNERDEFITSFRAAFAGQSEAMGVLQVFQEGYSPDRAISWLRRNHSFCHILENSFQSVNTRTMYIFRSVIRDIEKQFEQSKFTSPTSLYYGQLMSNEEIQVLSNSVGKITVKKSFFLATYNLDVAMVFPFDTDGKKCVLFEIEANPQVEGTKPFMKTGMIHNQRDVSEVIFMTGSSFRINAVRNDGDSLTIVKMTLCANEGENSIKNQLKITHGGNDLIEYAQLQYDLSEILKYPGALHHAVELLEKYLNGTSEDPDRCYDLLGSITFAMENWDACLHWSLKSFEIKRQSLPPNDPQLVPCYEHLSYVYLNKGEPTKALESFKQILIIFKQLFGDDHLNLVQYYLRMIEIYEYERQFTDVISCYNQIFDIVVKHHPIDDLNLAPIYSNIGRTWASLFQYPIALGYYQTSLNIKLKHLTTPSDSTALSYKNIAFVYQSMNNNEQAKVHFQKAVAIYRELHSPTYEAVVEIEEILQNLSSSI